MAVCDDFAAARVSVQEFLRPQRASIGYFWDVIDRVYYRTAADRLKAEQAQGRTSRGGVHRLTSTVTCLESLLEAPAWEKPLADGWDNKAAQQTLNAFMLHALSTTVGWESDQAAWVYCRVRTVGAALRLIDTAAGGFDASHRSQITKLLTQAWSSRHDAGGSFGLREATKPPEDDAAWGGEAGPDQYPPNAFLTYWGLLAAELAAAKGLLQEDPGDPEAAGRLRARNAAKDWLKESLAAQVAFQYTGSRFADPQQLAWSLCGLVRFTPSQVLSNSVSYEYELLIAGLKAFFAQQQGGTWATGAPLFHYASAGNAYAYGYETLAELTCLASSTEVDRAAGETLSGALRGYSAELLAALDHARSTGQRLADQDSGGIGWSSGHHPHRNSPESWATASVYRFAQGLRRLVGSWSCADAKLSLGARRPAADETTLAERGATWDVGTGTAGAFMGTAFIYPVLRAAAEARNTARFWDDPDERVLDDVQARSAMLFGPPGTSKTKMVEAVAGAIKWDFVEITPAQFLDRGVDYVSAQADAIFRQAMELDHCVVLLDEIDELIQERSEKAETIERFFTTTMLPRLAKLWEARRILFFVNTNNIKRVDSAIVRSQRFDAAKLILPPGYSSKLASFEEKGVELSVAEQDINDAIFSPDKIAVTDREIGWLALIRYDQYDAVVRGLPVSSGTGGAPTTNSQLSAALRPVARELSRLDWHDQAAPDAVPDTGTARETQIKLPLVKELVDSERRDARMVMWTKLNGTSLEEVRAAALAAQLPIGGDDVVELEDEVWVNMGSPDNPDTWARNRGLQMSATGEITAPSNGESTTAWVGARGVPEQARTAGGRSTETGISRAAFEDGPAETGEPTAEVTAS